jgi:hypothetical protein
MRSGVLIEAYERLHHAGLDDLPAESDAISDPDALAASLRVGQLIGRAA